MTRTNEFFHFYNNSLQINTALKKLKMGSYKTLIYLSYNHKPSKILKETINLNLSKHFATKYYVTF
jgi:hypothetical protein